MALLAETLIDEWLNRQGFFTVRGIKHDTSGKNAGVGEIDLLGVRPSRHSDRLDAWHLEAQVSFRPVGYITPWTAHLMEDLKVKRNSAKQRTDQQRQECVQEWVEKKFLTKAKNNARERAWEGQSWKFVFVHGVAKDQREIHEIGKRGIEVIPFAKVLKELCDLEKPGLTGAAGTDIAELIRFFHEEAEPMAVDQTYLF
ncbi:hypothetical protein H7849_12080 [Alloacidobacterium dinghuense]|uniref:Uncharacterized protein n=1 Tax=Alloacidobacterium dinghuense TaxID=2763107 RepID=A0A7G8BPU2_9BACT|nr:hypothetical protein [Alloacidobacterium dinghuense]QNI34562.1 hypothetical protein H7849_12080 [Alloacidobacterium dinghuense]